MSTSGLQRATNYFKNQKKHMTPGHLEITFTLKWVVGIYRDPPKKILYSNSSINLTLVASRNHATPCHLRGIALTTLHHSRLTRILFGRQLGYTQPNPTRNEQEHTVKNYTDKW